MSLDARLSPIFRSPNWMRDHLPPPVFGMGRRKKYNSRRKHRTVRGLGKKTHRRRRMRMRGGNFLGDVGRFLDHPITRTALTVLPGLFV